MAKPPTQYGASVKLKSPESEVSQSVVQPLRSVESAQLADAPSARRRPMESKADPTIVYLHPDGKYELKRFALALGPKVKVHDLLIEAIEEWAQRKGIVAPIRVPSERPRRKQ